MKTPDRKHIEAVAKYAIGARDLLLAVDDPALLDAMEDFLVRSGRLKERPVEWGVQRPEPYEGVIHGGEPYTDRKSAEGIQRIYYGEGSASGLVYRRRYMTDWEEEAPNE